MTCELPVTLVISQIVASHEVILLFDLRDLDKADLLPEVKPKGLSFFYTPPTPTPPESGKSISILVTRDQCRHFFLIILHYANTFFNRIKPEHL